MSFLWVFKITCILALILSRLPDITSWYIQQDWKRFYRRFKLALDRTLTGEGMNTNGQYYFNIMHCAAWILNFSNIRKNRWKHWYISFCFYFNCFVCFLVCIIHTRNSFTLAVFIISTYTLKSFIKLNFIAANRSTSKES